MFRSHRIVAATLATLLFAGVLSSCGGSKSSNSDSSSGATSESTSASTAGPSTTARLLAIDINYRSCVGSTLTITTDGGGEINGVEISRNDAAKSSHTSKMSKNADGSWTGEIPSGAGYEDRISVIVTSEGGRKSTRSSPLPLTVADGSTSTCA